MSSYGNTRKILGERRVNAAALDMRYRDFVDVIGEAVSFEAARTPGGIKAIARAANMNERTLENIAQKRSGPNGMTLLKLMAVLPRAQAEARRLAAMEANLDPELERELSALITRYQKMTAPRC